MNARSRLALRSLTVAAVLLGALGVPSASADAGAPSQQKSRSRTCCALASHLPLHLGSSHVPVALGIVMSAEAIGAHSYSGAESMHETNGIIYTRRGGFIDLGHTREYADLTARLLVMLGPMLARGEGTVHLARDGEVRVRVTARVPEAALAGTAALLARRIAFQLSMWTEITQHYGHRVVRGAEEFFSAFTPEDLYSNLLGTYLGAAAVESSLPYDRAMDALLADALTTLQATSSSEARRILAALDGRWWRADTPWPAPTIPIARAFDIGPRLHPMLPPRDLVPPAEPVVLDVPEVDAEGAPLAALYRLEIAPDLHAIPRFAGAGAFPVVTGEDLPRLVDAVRRSYETGAAPPGSEVHDEPAGPLAHYILGLRLLDLKLAGGLGAPPSGSARGVVGGSLVGVRGDTRGGDFALARFDVSHTAERGLVAGFSLFHADAVYFCHDPETRRTRPPLISLLGPCSRGEWLGLGGSLAEAFHDGRTGRTALRPVSLYGVLNALGNGQSPSHDGLRLLLRGGGAVEHVWTQQEGGVTIPRVGGSALMLARTPGRSLEARGGVGYRLDPSTPRDAGFESNLALRWYFLVGGKASAGLVDGVDPWGVASLGLEGGYSFWTRPRHSYADIATPFVSAVQSGTWQLLFTVTLGFQGLTF